MRLVGLGLVERERKLMRRLAVDAQVKVVLGPRRELEGREPRRHVPLGNGPVIAKARMAQRGIPVRL